MSFLSSWSTKCLTAWRCFKSVETCRFISTGRYLSENLETDFIEKYNDKKEKCVNEVRLLGRVGSDAMVLTKDGKPYAKFSLATNSYWRSDNDEQQRTEWHTILVFEPTLVTGVGKYVRKGQRLYVSGKLGYSADNSSTKKNAYILLSSFIGISS